MMAYHTSLLKKLRNRGYSELRLETLKSGSTYHICSPIDVYVLVVNIVRTFSCTSDYCIYMSYL